MKEENVYNDLYRCLTNSNEFSDDEVVIEYFGCKYTYAKLKELIGRTVFALDRLGLKEGDKVVMSLFTSPESIGLVYACSSLGVIPVMADIRLSQKDYEKLLDDTGAKMLFVNDICSYFVDNLAGKRPQLQIFVVSPCDGMNMFVRAAQKAKVTIRGNFYGFSELFRKNVFSWARVMKKSQPLCKTAESAKGGQGEIIFTTSGTTGSWKYVVLKSYQLNLAAIQDCEIGESKEIKTVLSVMPIFACYGFIVSVHLPLILSKKVYLYPIIKAKKIPKAMLKYKPNFFAGVFGQYGELTKSKQMQNADLSFLKMLYFGGDRYDPEVLDRVNVFLAEHGSPARLCQGYGMTEVSSCAVMQLNDDSYVEGSAGKAMRFTEIKIINCDTAEELPVGQKGEICLHTPCQTDGYFGDDEATEELLRAHEDGKVWVHTGDLGYMDEAGNLYVIGRIKNMIVSRSGTKIFPSVIEEAMNDLPAVSEAAVVVFDDEHDEYEKKIVLFISGRGAGIKGKAWLCCRRSLPMYLLPDKIVTVSSIPHTSSGKKDYALLTKRAQKYKRTLSKLQIKKK